MFLTFQNFGAIWAKWYEDIRSWKHSGVYGIVYFSIPNDVRCDANLNSDQSLASWWFRLVTISFLRGFRLQSNYSTSIKQGLAIGWEFDGILFFNTWETPSVRNGTWLGGFSSIVLAQVGWFRCTVGWWFRNPAKNLGWCWNPVSNGITYHLV